MPHQLVLVRHGQSTWNLENRFTGWTDVDLTEQGRKEARQGALELAKAGFTFDVAYTSMLKRAIRTLWIIMDELDLMWLPVHRRWRLNERHYGDLQGLDKSETAAKHGEEQVFVWRRSYDVPPPPLAEDDERHPVHDRRYADVPADQLPATESLADTVDRFLPLWHDEIAPTIRAGKRVLIAAHGNSLRALVKYLEGMGADEISGFDIPTGIPFVYDLDDDLKPLRRSYLGDQEAAKKAAEAVANQARVR